MARKKRRQSPGPRIIDENEWEELEQLAWQEGMEMRASLCNANKKRPFMHVMFERNGERVLNWWPSSGTYSNQVGLKGKELDGKKVVDIAACLIGDSFLNAIAAEV